MSHFLIFAFGISVLSAGHVTALPFNTLWQLGLDDSETEPFMVEDYVSNNAPGSTSLKDDDYYLAGTYPAPIGTVSNDENITFFERALSSGDPRKRIHFPLTATQASQTSQLRITLDFMNGGAWTGVGVPGYSTHEITVKFNGNLVAVRSGITRNTTITLFVSASSVAAVSGENILQIERTAGGAGGYINFDFLKLEINSTALADVDGDGMMLWFEETYGLNDGNSADSTLDPDGDGLTNLTEFQSATNPTDLDTDNDNLSDAQELARNTNPLKNDTDDDGISDGLEITTNPLLADSDNDNYPDNIELEQGSDPTSAASLPFAFPGAISLQFIDEGSELAFITNGQPAGYFRQPNWNASDPLPGWMPSESMLTASKNALKNHLRSATTVNATWSYHHAGRGQHKGSGDERLLNGMIKAERTATTNTSATVNLTGITYPSYDILIYVGWAYPSGVGIVQRGTDATTNRYFKASSAPPFLGWKEITSNALDTPTTGNYVRYRNLTGATQTISLQATTDQTVAIHGIQIIRSGTDADGDGMLDLVEIENRFDPRIADATADADSDGLSNASEITLGTNPRLADTDHDGLLDGAEAASATSPLDPDSDNDTLTDGEEVNAYPFPSSPTLIDSDNDGFSDAVERNYGSNPLSNGSTPPPVPIWNAATRTWLWRIDNLRVIWNHNQSMLGAINSDDAMLFEAVADIGQSGWRKQIGIGVRYVNGKLVHRFRAIEEAFHRNGQPSNGFWVTDWSTSPTDRTSAFGFSKFGTADESAPLRLEFSATQPDPAVNLWTINFLIADLTNPISPITIASYSDNSGVAADPSLLAGNSVWENRRSEIGRIIIETEAGVRALISPNSISPADNDNDGMPNTWETTHTFNTTNAADASLDADSDELSNLKEYLAGTNPRNADSDGDGANDNLELIQGYNPLAAASVPIWFNFSGKIDDLNNDGLSDAWMLWSGAKNRLSTNDDDGDGMNNLAESIAGTNPDDANSNFNLRGWRDSNNYQLSWTNLPEKASRVEVSDTLNLWQNATGMPSSTIINSRRQLSIPSVFPSATNNHFYRIGIQPIDTDNDGVEDWTENNVLFSSVTSGSSLGQSLTKQNGQVITGDAVSLLDRLQGSAPTGGIPGSSTSGTPSQINASRFLMQSTFGPTPDAIQEVRNLGFSAWIDRQVTLPPTLLQPYIREIKADGAGPKIDPTYSFNEQDQFVFGNNVTTPFARAAIAGEDQLRQRVAFALSQILVVSRRDANLEERAEAMANYYDVLIRNALGNYGNLLQEVTFHPAMGTYLSHVGNQKADPSISRYPDENYAREIMQLFTIGLWELNADGSRKLDNIGQPIPTYDNGTVTEFARTFTGLYYAAPYGWGGGGWDDEHYLQPMVMYADRHDFDKKQLTNGIIIPAREASNANGVQDIRDAVDALFRSPNTPPFICRQLIQFLVTDNPSSAFVRRIQDVFVNDGMGTRGNLAAVVKAILLDPEARNQPLSPSYGKVREPVIRTMHLGRLLNLAKEHPKFVWWNWPDNFYALSIQEPLNSPSVFNFYTPLYQAPGDIRNAGYVSPGFQIVNTYSAVSFPNLLWSYLHRGFSAANTWYYPLNYSAPLLLSDSANALVAHVDLLICSGNMTARTRDILLTALANPALSQQDRVALAVWSAMTCPEGVIQK